MDKQDILNKIVEKAKKEIQEQEDRYILSILNKILGKRVIIFCA